MSVWVWVRVHVWGVFFPSKLDNAHSVSKGAERSRQPPIAACQPAVQQFQLGCVFDYQTRVWKAPKHLRQTYK